MGRRGTDGGRRRRLLVSLLVAVALGGCAALPRTDDTRIEAEVKARLVAERDANLTRLGVVSRNATVYLSGTVPSADQRELAERLARGVRDVRRVINTVDVRTPAQ